MKSRSHSIIPVVAVAMACFLAACTGPASTTPGRNSAQYSTGSGIKDGCTPAIVARYATQGTREVDASSVQWPSGLGYLGKYQPSCAFENDQLSPATVTQNETQRHVFGVFIGASEAVQNAIFSESRKRLAGWEELHWDPDWLGDDFRSAVWGETDAYIDGMDVQGGTGLNLYSLFGVGQFIADSNLGLDPDTSFLEVHADVGIPTRP